MSEVSICNTALIALGQPTIMALSEENPRARACKEEYPKKRDALLQAYDWNFAITRAALAQVGTDPLYEWDAQFALPTNPYCLRVLQLGEITDTDAWRIEGRYLMTNESSASIRYIARVTDTTKMSPLFQDCLAFYLATIIAYQLDASQTVIDQVKKDFKESRQKATTTDARESSPRMVRGSKWANARA